MACRAGRRKWPEHAVKRITGRQFPSILPWPTGRSRRVASRRAALAPHASASTAVAPCGRSTRTSTAG
eukprot:2674310-Alexandrium_andersonii.AAC.1